MVPGSGSKNINYFPCANFASLTQNISGEKTHHHYRLALIKETPMLQSKHRRLLQ
jgi:hypothetical protein